MQLSLTNLFLDGKATPESAFKKWVICLMISAMSFLLWMRDVKMCIVKE